MELGQCIHSTNNNHMCVFDCVNLSSVSCTTYMVFGTDFRELNSNQKAELFFCSSR